MAGEIGRVISPDGTMLAFRALGAGRPPVVAMRPPQFSHLMLERDAGSSHHEYERVADLRTIIRFDPRGTGLSQRRPRDHSLDARVADLEAVIEATGGARRVILDAISSSGLTALAFAIRRPERVDGIVLQNAFADGGAWWGTPMRQALLQIAELDWELCSETWAWFTWGDERRDAMLKLAAHIRACIDQKDLLAMVEEEQRVDLRPRLRAIRAPVLVLNHPHFKRMAPGNHNRALAAALPGAQLVDIHSTRDRVAAIRAFIEGKEIPRNVPAAEPLSVSGHSLSRREIDVLRLLAGGLTNREIAGELVLSVRTVDAHVRNIFAKTDSQGRAQAVAFAIRHGLLRGAD
jgi:DNA-binding NarL/FixJ family response regulator